MAIIERDVVLQGKTEAGESTIDMPITALKNVEDTADVKDEPEITDFIPIIDSSDKGQMKKTPFKVFEDATKATTAEGTSYDNSKTKIEAENVQDALDTLLSEALPKLTIKAPAGSSITIKDSKTTLTGKIGSDGTLTVTLPRTGTWTVTATLGDGPVTKTVEVNEIGKTYILNLLFFGIYGVEWDKTESSKLSRTDDAALFKDPTPAVNGGNGSSPFDDIAPWSEIVKEEIDDNVMVKIPKFWYKWTNEGSTIKLQIANKETEGFHVSPAHADRNDGKGEREFVWIARYKASDQGGSVSGGLPLVNVTRSQVREIIPTVLSDGFYSQDYAMFWTIRMLYLVEFADWDGQKVIGYNCGNGEAAENTGSTDTMRYHTGTMLKTRTEYGVGVQYRWIEDPWGNVAEWVDGIRLDNLDLYITTNPAEYSDTEGGVKVGTVPEIYGYISDWTVPSVEGMEWALYPSAATKETLETLDDPKYVGDVAYSLPAENVAFICGGAYSQDQSCGPFVFGAFNTASFAFDFLGARLQYLP